MKIALWGILLVLFSSVFATAAQTADLDVPVEDLSVSEDTLEEQTPLAPAAVVDQPEETQEKKPSQEPYYYYITYSQQEENAAAISASTAKAQAILQQKLDILYYVPYHQYIAKVSEQDLLTLQDDGYVVDYKLFREQPGRYRVSDTGETLYYVYAFQEEDVFFIRQALEQLDIPVIDVKDYILVINLKDMHLLDDLLSQIIQIEGVEAIEPRPTYEFFNDKTNVVVGTVDVRQRLGLFGEGQIIAIADTGLDTGKNDGSMHLDFQGRILSLLDLAYDPTNVCQGLNNPDDKRGHGTHVAGSAVGNGRQSGSDPATHYYPLGSYAGAAPEARLVFQAIGCDQSGIGLGVPVPKSTMLFLPAYQQGARVHSNSYGGLTDGGYYASDKDADSFVNQYKEMVLVFAAGNSGSGPMTTANNLKNGINVGGVQRDQPNSQVYSRGPTKDGRFKPDILTPAIDLLSPTNEGIISTKSSVQQPYPIGCKDWPQSPYYCGMAGTSMATPNAAGSVALLREYLIKKRNMPTPSAALVKALYLNGGESLGNSLPSTDYGWGRANLTRTLVADSQVYYDLATYDIRTGLSTGQKRTFTLAVKPRKPLRLTLVWTDKEGCSDISCPPATNPRLVNDLDLIVIDPQNNQYNGNDITAPYNDQWDRRNNVERVEIQNPVAGAYTIEVRGYNIPSGPQDFALVATYDNALVEFTPALPAKLCMVNGNPC